MNMNRKKLNPRNTNDETDVKKTTSLDKPFDRLIRKHIALAVLSFVAVALFASGVSYALFQIDHKNTVDQTVAVGTLDTNISSIEGGIVVTDLYPQRESDITNSDKKYTFTIANTGTYDVEYEVYLKDATDALLASSTAYSEYKRIANEHYQYINYKLDEKKAQNLTSVQNGEKFVILKGFLSAGASEDHSIQFFLDNGDTTETGAPNEINGSVLSLDIYFDGFVSKGNTMAYTRDEKLWAHKADVKTITFENTLSPKEEATYTYDLSEKQDKTVMAYLMPTETDATKYDVYIQGDGIIQAPSNSSNLFSDFTNLINIEGMEYFDTSRVTYMNSMFYRCYTLTTLDLSNFDTSNAIYMDFMFASCGSLTSLDLSNFNTSKVTGMSNMFYSCSSLTSLNLGNFNTSKVTSMSTMFYGCSSLTSLDLSNFNTGKVTNMSMMFNGCRNLTTLDLSNFNTSNVTTMHYMFGSCSSLTSLDLSHFNTSNVTTMQGMFGNCTNLKTLDVSNFDTSKVITMGGSYSTSGMFYNCKSLTTTITIRGTACTEYSYMFSVAATNSGAQITVNYTSDASSLVDSMIATKSSGSNVVKGSVVS